MRVAYPLDPTAPIEALPSIVTSNIFDQKFELTMNIYFKQMKTKFKISFGK